MILFSSSVTRFFVHVHIRDHVHVYVHASLNRVLLSAR